MPAIDRSLSLSLSDCSMAHDCRYGRTWARSLSLTHGCCTAHSQASPALMLRWPRGAARVMRLGAMNFAFKTDQLCNKDDEFCRKYDEFGMMMSINAAFWSRPCLPEGSECQVRTQRGWSVQRMNFSLNTRNCVSKTRNFVSKTRNFVFKMMNFAREWEKKWSDEVAITSKIDESCMKIDGFCNKNDDFVIQTDRNCSRRKRVGKREWSSMI